MNNQLLYFHPIKKGWEAIKKIIEALKERNSILNNEEILSFKIS